MNIALQQKTQVALENNNKYDDDNEQKKRNRVEKSKLRSRKSAQHLQEKKKKQTLFTSQRLYLTHSIYTHTNGTMPFVPLHFTRL